MVRLGDRKENVDGYDIVIISKNYFEKLKQDSWTCASENRDLYKSTSKISQTFDLRFFIFKTSKITVLLGSAIYYSDLFWLNYCNYSNLV